MLCVAPVWPATIESRHFKVSLHRSNGFAAAVAVASEKPAHRLVFTVIVK
jgi:hypothetical protein